ncbi:iron chelate uptake ABC transporter family permease subunit [Streptomyces cyaneofuscatus]|uniref:FecCD family ABC transporter permease n=1 Tax=Streptomyces cyaneofuscatus TaxID=66883 RepID=UPI00340B8DDE
MIVGALLLAGGFLLVSLCVGAYPVTVPEVGRALFYGTGDRLAVHFVNQERLPQALLAILVGCALGISGAIFQSVSRNALASPDVIGFDSGAATGAILVIVTFGGAAASVAAGAVAGGLATALAVSVLASRGGLHGIRLVLIGLGVTAMLGSVNSYLLTRSSLNDAQSAHIWLVGTLDGRGWSSVQTMAVALAVLLPLALLYGRRLRMMELGGDLATGPGVRVNPFAARTDRAGHRAVRGRRGERRTHPVVVRESQRNNLPPVGVTTAVLGGAYLAWVLFKRRGTGTA